MQADNDVSKLITDDLVYFIEWIWCVGQYVVLFLIVGCWVFAEYIQNNYTINFSNFQNHAAVYDGSTEDLSWKTSLHLKLSN